MTGKAREHEIRLMGLGLAALALLAAVATFWVASAIGDGLHVSGQSGAALAQVSSGS
jgi:hypothetical protein